MSADANTAYVIVEETVQRLYHIDPEDHAQVEFFDQLRAGVIAEERFVDPSAILAKRSKKGAPSVAVPAGLESLETRTVMTGLTLLNRVDGKPVHEVKWTNTTVVTKPVKS